MNKKKYKKYFNATLAATVAASGVTFVAPTETKASALFSDVSKNNNFYNEITSLAEREIIKGYSDGTFRPGANVTRGQAAKIIAGVLGLDTKNVKNPNFKDVKSTNAYYGAIAALVNAGIINGYGDGTFKPFEPVKRNHMAKIIAGAFELKTTPGYNTPLKDIGGEYADYITALYEYGVTTGKTKTTFDGFSNVSRGQLAAFVVRAENIVNSTKENNLTFTIDTISKSNIQTSEGEFAISSSLKTIFSSENEIALKGAEVKALIVNGEIKGISSIKLNNSGSKEELVVFDVGNTEINSNIEINADFVSLKNIVVNKNVLLTNKVTNSFSLENASIKGELKVEEAANNPVASLYGFFANTEQKLSVNLNKSLVNILQVNRNNLSITSNAKLSAVKIADGVTTFNVNADIENLTISGTKKLNLTGKGAINKVSIENNVEFNLDIVGNVNEIQILNSNTKINLGQNIVIDRLVLPVGLGVSDVISNYSSHKSKIKEVVNSQGSKIDTSSNSNAGGSSDSGGNTGSNGNPNGGSNIAPTNITSAGTYGPATGTQTIQGDVTISSQGVTLRNVIVTGKLILEEAIGEGDVHLQGVNVQGETVVKGGGKNSVYFTNSLLATVIVNKNTGAVRIVAQGSTQVYEVQLDSPTIVVENNLSGNATGFNDIIVSEAMQSQGNGFHVELVGTFETINSRATNVQINLSEQTDIATLVLNAAATVLGQGAIRTARINANGSTLAQRPNNVVLDITNGGSVTVGGNQVTESYSDPNAITSITSVKATQGRISLETENFVALTKNDFIVSAKIDGQEVQLQNLEYDTNRQQFTFDPIQFDDNLDKTVNITVTPNSAKLTGQAKTASFVIATGFGGRITDIQGVGIPNLTIHFRKGIGTRDGEVVATATTDKYGYYNVNVAAGTYTGEISSPGYLKTYLIGVASSDSFSIDQNETAMRAAATNEVKIMLSWGEYPEDLDSHLNGPQLGGGNFHVYYSNTRDVANGLTYVDLDWDDTDSYGPETTTIRKLLDGQYRFYIHNYSGWYDNYDEIDEVTLRESGAKVAVYLGNSNTPDHTFNVPIGDGKELYWLVCDLIVSNNGEKIEVKEINEMRRDINDEESSPLEITLQAVQEAVTALFGTKDENGTLVVDKTKLADGVNQAAITAASEKVAALADTVAEKEDLQADIETAQSLLDNASAAAKLQAAQEAVTALFGIKDENGTSVADKTKLADGVNQAAITAASEKVTALADTVVAEKAGLQADIQTAQNLLNKKLALAKVIKGDAVDDAATPENETITVTKADYEAAEITGVTDDNLAKVKATIKAASPAPTTKAEVQAIVDEVNGPTVTDTSATSVTVTVTAHGDIFIGGTKVNTGLDSLAKWSFTNINDLVTSATVAAGLSSGGTIVFSLVDAANVDYTESIDIDLSQIVDAAGIPLINSTTAANTLLKITDGGTSWSADLVGNN